MLRTFSLLGLTLNAVNAYFESCDHSITRLKQGPEIWTDVIASNKVYEDPAFNGFSALYRFPYEDLGKWRDYELNHWIGTYYFQRLGEVYPDATMFGNTNPEWHDIMQGMAGTCYIEASLASIAEFPAVVQNVFVTSEKNNAGIYAFRFFIRGKPWIVTVDDYFLFYTASDGTRTPYFARIGSNEQFWAMMLEKAWAKVKGTYTMADGGFVENGLRSLVGCPVYSYSTTDQDADTVHAMIMTADSLNYIMGAATSGGTDSQYNSCGIAMSHAYSLISAFELKTASVVDHKMYMIRNPWGTSTYTGSWNGNDAAWTSAYISQVPHSVNPTTSQSQGIFFVNSADFLTCFADFQIAHYRDGEGYTDTWYDVEGDLGLQNTFEVTIPAVDGDLYLTVETYFYGLVPSTCWENGQAPKLTQYIYRNSNDAANLAYSRVNDFDIYHQPMMFDSSNYTAGEKFVITVQYDWQYGLKMYPARDYTVKVYSKQNLDVKDSLGRTNMWHMDGQFPSGFTNSHFRKDTTTWTSTWTPRSLYDIWIASNNMAQFADLVLNNIWTLGVWYQPF